MSLSIYYSAKRRSPLNNVETEAVEALTAKYSVDKKIEEYIATGVGLNWESFDYRLNSVSGSLFKKGVVFEGATKLPDRTAEASWEGVQHWCSCLSEIRQAISGAEWSVHVEDHEIQWVAARGAFDPQI